MTATAASGEPKADIAVEIATLVLLLAQSRGDRVALVAGDGERLLTQPARSGTSHLVLVLRMIERALDPAGPLPDLGRVLRRVSLSYPRRSLVLIITDEAHPDERHSTALRSLRLRHEILLLSIADADPLTGRDGAPAVDVVDGWGVPPAVAARADLIAEARAARATRAHDRRRLLRRMAVHDVVVHGSADIIPAMVDLLRRSRHGRR